MSACNQHLKPHLLCPGPASVTTMTPQVWMGGGLRRNKFSMSAPPWPWAKREEYPMRVISYLVLPKIYSESLFLFI